MSHDPTTNQGVSPRADHETILARLIARDAHLDRQLDAALRAARLPRAALALAATAQARVDPHEIAAAERRLAAEPVATGPSWEELNRPSLAALSRQHRCPLRRA